MRHPTSTTFRLRAPARRAATATFTRFTSCTAVATLAALALLAGCGGGDSTGPSPEPVASIDLGPANPTVDVGSTLQMTATTRDKNGNALSGRAVTWSTPAGTTTLSVDPNTGLVTGLVAGPGTVIATSEQKTNQITVTVTRRAVATVALTPDSARTGATIVAGDTLVLTATPKDANGNTLAGRTVTYTSNNESVARVTSDGKVVGVAAGGPVTITATSDTASTTATVTVYQPYALVSVNGNALPATLSGLTIVRGRMALFASSATTGHYYARIGYSTGHDLFESGTYTQAGNTLTLTSSTAGTNPGSITLSGNQLTLSSGTGALAATFVFQR